MVQYHKIILWKEPDSEEGGFDDIAKDAFSIMDVFQQFPSEWRPNYLPGYRKSDKRFEWNYENFVPLLKKGANREGKKVFSDLGYRIGFFSSLDDDESFGHSLGIGNTKFTNVLVTDIALNLDLTEKTNADKIVLLFEKLVDRFSPYWGCISNSYIVSEYGYFDKEKNLPKTTYWVNYFNDAILDNIGREKIQEVLDKYEGVTFKDGFLKIKDTAIDFEDAADIQLHKEIDAQLGL